MPEGFSLVGLCRVRVIMFPFSTFCSVLEKVLWWSLSTKSQPQNQRLCSMSLKSCYYSVPITRSNVFFIALLCQVTWIGILPGLNHFVCFLPFLSSHPPPTAPAESIEDSPFSSFECCQVLDALYPLSLLCKSIAHTPTPIFCLPFQANQPDGSSCLCSSDHGRGDEWSSEKRRGTIGLPLGKVALSANSSFHCS